MQEKGKGTNTQGRTLDQKKARAVERRKRRLELEASGELPPEEKDAVIDTEDEDDLA